jgi:hypothetical protein
MEDTEFRVIVESNDMCERPWAQSGFGGTL